MSVSIQTGLVHHVAITVTDVPRSVDFYTSMLGFQVVMEIGSRVLLSNGSMVLAITSPTDPSQAISGDRFNENRVGLDHISFKVSRKTELERAIALFDSAGVSYGEIKDLGPDLGIYVLAFRDPDDIQVELTAPYG
jgi:glyoxylase I family protein